MSPGPLGYGAAAGALAGLGVALVCTGLVPPRPGLAEAMAAMERTATPARGPARSLDERVGRVVEALLGPGARPWLVTATDLTLLDVDGAALRGAQVVCALAGALLAPVLALVLGLTAALTGARVTLAWSTPVGGALALGSAGFALPAVDLRRRANRRRRDVLGALSSLLDVMTLALTAGELISGALALGCASSDGWVFSLLRRVLADADRRGVPPWDAMARAAADRALPELGEVAASVRLAGSDGAQIRRTLAAKAEAFRTRSLAEQHRRANESTTRMVLPLVGFVIGFIGLMAFPALSRILGSA